MNKEVISPLISYITYQNTFCLLKALHCYGTYRTVENFREKLISLFPRILLLPQKLIPQNLIVVHNAMIV